MFIGVTGEPGSGKSAYAVNYVLEHTNNYKNIFININGFKINKLINVLNSFTWHKELNHKTNIKTSYAGYLIFKHINYSTPLHYKALNFPELHSILSNCKDIYDTQIEMLGKEGGENVIDKPIVDYLLSISFISLNEKYTKYVKDTNERNKKSFFERSYLNIKKPIKKEFKYLPTLFVIDEVQNHMGAIDPISGKESRTADPILTWWVSYHRHLFMDVIILSQQYQKIHIAYRRDIGYFLDGIESQSMLLGKSSPHLIYNKHKDSPYTNKNKAGKVKVKKTKKLFDMYESGDEVRTKSVIVPYLIFAFLFLVLTVVVFYYIVTSFGGGEEIEVIEKERTTYKNISNQKTTIVNDSNSYKDLTYIKLNCLADTCINKKHEINLNVDDLNSTIVYTESKFLTYKPHSANFATVTLLVSRDFLNLFQGAKHEKNDKGFTILN